MNKRNPKSPWNPASSTKITPEDYEKQVVSWLRAADGILDKFEVQHLKHLSGSGGDYEFDAVAEFSVLSGANILILVECKRYSRPVDREKILALWAKLQDVKAHKAMMFATCGFQSGALEFATTYNIATITFVDGIFTYATKASGISPKPPPWANIPSYAGLFLKNENGSIHSSTIDIGRIDELSKWLNESEGA